MPNKIYSDEHSETIEEARERVEKSHFTADERETTITATDGDDTVRIWTAQRGLIGRLSRNPAFTKVKEGHYGQSPWAEFEIPAERFDLAKSAKHKQNLSPEDRARRAESARTRFGTAKAS